MSLCMTHRAGDAIKVGEITLLVVRVRGKQVRLRYIGPKEVRIERVPAPPPPPKDEVPA